MCKSKPQPFGSIFVLPKTKFSVLIPLNQMNVIKSDPNPFHCSFGTRVNNQVILKTSIFIRNIRNTGKT